MTADPTVRTMSRPRRALQEIVTYACMAPSVHNTQPWSWHVDGDSIALHSDTRRQLAHADPSGRDLAISCGAALHHAQVAAGALGWTATVDRLPEGEDSTLLAVIGLTAAAPAPDAIDLLQSIRDRHTDRRRFTSWPVPKERLDHLAEVAAEWGADAVVVHEPGKRVRTELLVGRAFDRQAADPGVAEEQKGWVNRSARDGVPDVVIPADLPTETHRRTRFGGGLLTEPDRELEATDGLLLLRGGSDDVLAWLRTGEGLSALWLQATAGGLSVVPLSQAIEVEETRERLRSDVLHGLGAPHMLVRVGWQAIGRGLLPRTPRRPLEDVLTW
ncbi:NAD(P)H nitroreductase [Nocardioides sp. JQ2195]|uniref:Acg family FMN-binding oxidoreductase n=1 Tax=Nocardioides sp. JQ2195 TaxID=2592334 RepID=UPI00143E2D49|nr:NAD(P)H nitroreductase [Nocardioides sp. JQ2195]QIX26723.1 NAD(P)H nitroreductase [Nocardioides sp. JQ2195]